MTTGIPPSPSKTITHHPLASPPSSTEVQMPWVEKYRPAKLEDLVAHEDIVAILTRLIDSDNLPHLLLYGPPGTGKVCCWLLVPVAAALVHRILSLWSCKATPQGYTGSGSPSQTTTTSPNDDIYFRFGNIHSAYVTLPLLATSTILQ